MEKNTKAIQEIEKKQVNPISTSAQKLVIKDDASLKKATDNLSDIKDAQKILKAEKEKITKPANEIIKWAREKFRPLEDTLKDAEGTIKGKMLTYNEEKEAEAKKKEEQIAKRVEKGTMKFDTGLKKMDDIDHAESTVSGKKGMIQTRTIKKVVIVDENKLPREYLMPNETLIRKEALSGKEIPGVEVREEKVIASR